MSRIAQVRTLALALMTLAIILVVVMFFVLSPGSGATTPDERALLVVVGVGLAGTVLIHLVGYRTRAYREGIPPRIAVERGAKAFTSRAIVRLALCEAPLIAALVVAVTDPHGGILSMAVGAAITIVLVLLHGLPNRAQIRRVQRSLEREGARVPLLQAYADQHTA